MRRSRRPKVNKPLKVKPSEHTEQVQVVAHVRHFHPDVLIAAVPNGGLRSKTEGARLKLEGVLPGYPDLLIDEPRGPYHGLRIEMKRVGGEGARSNQREVLVALAARGYRVQVCHGAEVAIGVIESYLQLPSPFDPLA